MDALNKIQKFIQKKKTDKAFKSAGPGQTLTSGGGGGSSSGKQSISNSQPSQQAGKSQSKSPARGSTEERKTAAAAALARLEKSKKPIDDSEKMRASRQVAFIKEQARKELEAEKALEQTLKTVKQESSQPEFPRKSSNPLAMAVSGVFFSCPLIGPEILSKGEIEENIKNFLLEQPEEELGVTACLLIHSCNKPIEKIANCVETLCKYLDNIISNPSEHKFRKIRCSNKVFQEKVAVTLGYQQFLTAAGFKSSLMKPDASSQEEEFWVFHPLDENAFVAHLTELRDMLRQTTPIKPELDRNLQVLMPAQVKTRRDLPDEFYTLSLDEVKREQQLKSELANKELSLRTKAMRDRDEQREQRLYRYAIMRIRFPDGLTLQGTFKAHEKLSNLFQFVKENLVSEDLKFQLVQSGGESLSDMDATLTELKLAPSSILNFKIDSAPAPLATGEISFLKPDVLALVTSTE